MKNTAIFILFLGLLCCLLSHSAFLRQGRPISFIKGRRYLHPVRLSGINQFTQHYTRCIGLELNQFYWGDEIEYGIFRKNAQKNYDLSVRSSKIREFLSKQEKTSYYADLPIGCEWQPEYGSWMIESVPKNPYGSYISDLLNVEKSMQLRRKRLHQALDRSEEEIAPTLSNFPMLGFLDPEKTKDERDHEHEQDTVRSYDHTKHLFGEIANSQYVADDIINPHPRFAALTRNIRQRKGSNVYISIPKDTNPLEEFHHPASGDVHPTTMLEPHKNKGGDHIHMDSMGFGMGCCCLQVTMQCRNEEESRYLHDQLAILAPILQALSASTPIFRGQFAATDTRWNIISQAVDDRTLVENGTITDPSIIISDHLQSELAGLGIQRLQKSRYSTVSAFIGKPKDSKELAHMKELNNLPIDINAEAFQFMRNAGIDEVLSTHIAHLFTRDPLVIFDDAIKLNDSETMDHFENIQSTNWRSMRWKLPALRIGKAYSEHRKRQLQDKIDHHGLANQSSLATKEEKEHDFSHNILFEDKFDIIHDNHNNNGHSEDMSNGTVSGNSSEVVLPHLPPPLPSPVLHEEDYPSLSDEDLQAYGPGWRIEFRPLEVQLTDYENAAFAIFSVLLTRCIASQGHNFYLPISYVEENMRRAQLKDAVLNQKFWIRRNAIHNHHHLQPKLLPLSLTSLDSTSPLESTAAIVVNTSSSVHVLSSLTPHPLARSSVHHEIPAIEQLDLVELTMDEIFNGEKNTSSAHSSSPHHTPFIGLVPMLLNYINDIGCDEELYVTKELLPYFSLLSDRASGKLPTTARWIRNQILKNASANINHDTMTIKPSAINELLLLCENIGMGRVQCPELYGQRQCKVLIEGNTTVTNQNETNSKSISDEVVLAATIMSTPIVANLDTIDEEDLMFTNFSCYLKPTISLSSLHNQFQSFDINITDLNLQQITQQTKLDREAGEELTSPLMNQLNETSFPSSISFNQTVTSQQQPVSTIQSIKNFVTSLFQRKKRNKEESIRF